ncbi:MAG: hypothetical protein NZ571_08655 [Anaerolineae bacterium]|nr:hypothetical protein [Anaerolineae bacterium]
MKALWAWAQQRFPALDERHPVAQRETRFMPSLMPDWVRRFTNFWTLVGFAALIHGVLFCVAAVLYSLLSPDLIPLISPFLTPFGTPIILAVLHTVLYWALLFGVSRHMAHSFSCELEAQRWSVLRLTPYSSDTLALVKVLVVVRAWYGVLRVLFALRSCALIILPLAFAAQRSREAGALSSLDVISAATFLVQPFTETFMVAALSLLSAILVQQPRWARLCAYGALILSVGALNGLLSMWLTFNAPMGALAGLLLPVGHWTPLIVTAFPPHSVALHAVQTFVLALTTVFLPLLIGTIAFGVSLWRLRQLA